jgi:hypothetical protein
VKSSNPLIVGQLVRIQKALLESRVGKTLWRMLHYIQHEADGLLGQC